MKKTSLFIVLLFAVMLFTGCDRGYDVRFTNYSTEVMDSVIVGNKSLLFTEVDRQSETGYSHLKKGTYGILCVSKSKKRYSSSITIAKKGSGKRSIQIDGTDSITVLED